VGLMQPHQRFVVAKILEHIDALDAIIGELSEEIQRRTAPAKEASERLRAIPGGKDRTTEAILAEVGPSRASSRRRIISPRGPV